MAAPAIPRAEIRFLVNRFHVGMSDSEVEKDIRSRTKDWPGVSRDEAVEYALEVHHENQDLYSDVMRGSFSKRNPSVRWELAKGGLAKAASSPGGGIYARSEDGRFTITVTRHRRGDPGRREYVYAFSAVDYGMPSGGRRYTMVPVMVGGNRGSEFSVDRKVMMESAEKWAELHPL